MPEDKKEDDSKGKKGKDGEGDDAPVAIPIDARVMWFEEKVCSALKIKNDKWKKLTSLNENVEIIYKFLDKEYTTILFYLNQKEELFPAIDFPSQLKRKSIYFLKKRPGAQITEKLDQELILGDLSANPLEFLSTVLEEVYLPLLTNPKNLESWPEVVASDVLRHFHQLNGAVCVISGKAKGKTMLPLPHGAKLASESDKTILHTLESAVIDWTHQIKEVIKSNSSAPLEEGLNPGPTMEIDFWAAKAANLKSIHQQLTDEKIQKISKVLQLSKSTYYPAFQMIFDEVVFALEEASDINTYLKALRPVVERLTGAGELSELSQIFPGLMHTLLMIWKSSKHYNTPNRLTVVLQEFCNDIIEQARNFIQPAELFNSEPEEAAERLRLVLRICESFKATYFECKAGTMESNRPWNFDSKLVFGRLDSFLVRVQQILELFETIIEFNRLEKIEIGGTKGKILSSQVVQIFTEFTGVLSGFSKLKYDVLNIALPDFDVDRNAFLEKITDLDRRIGTILCQAFDDCSGLYSCFRLLESFSGLLNRSHIQKDFELKYFELLKMYSQDLEDVSVIFLRYRDNPPIHYNMAPVTGAVAWIHELKDRISKAMDKLKSLNHAVMNTDEANGVKSKYNELMEALETYEQGVFNRWKDTIIDESDANLNKPILIREKNLLKVNFDPKVVALLREVKYFGALSVQPPPAAVDIYSKAETFRKYIFSLENIANMYNGIRTGVLDVEKPLIEEKIRQIDGQIEVAVSSLNWKSDTIDTYITDISGTVGNLSSVLQNMKNNLDQITKILKVWSATPLLERKDGKKLLNLEEKDAKLAIANDSIRKDGKTIIDLVEQTRQLVEASSESDQWARYRQYADTIVQKGFWTTIKSSMEYILQNMEKDRAAEVGPLLEAKLELENEMLVYTPSMEEDSAEGLMSVMESLLEDIYDVSSLMPRVAPIAAEKAPPPPIRVEAESGNGVSSADESPDGPEPSSTEKEKDLALKAMENETYLGEMRQDETLDNLRVAIIERVRAIMESCSAYKDGYEQYTYLWTENRQEYMKQFLQPADKGEEGDNAASSGEEEQQPVQLEKFEAEIRKFEGIHKTVMAIEPEVIFMGWFRVDARPLKQSLNVVVKKWSYTLTKHLSDDTVATLNELNSFIKLNKKGLQGKIEEGDYNGLVAAMGLLHAIKHRTGSIDKMFEPLRKTVNLLRQFGVELPEEIHKLLNDLPEEWSEVKKLSVSIKDHVAPLQAKEVDVLQQKCNRFEMKNHNFREEFRKKAPFKFDVGPDHAYELVDVAHFDVFAMETEATALKKSCELFELNVPTYRQLADCRRDVGMLKSIWDLVSLVTYMFGQWKTTLWTEIDTDSMENRCRDLSKELRRMDKEIKGWDAYAGLDQMVKDMITSLRAVGELRSNAIRDRHWKQLMKTTGVTFVLTKDMKFQDLLSLQLHKYEDDVKVIVDRATKELAMEKVLNDLDKTWAVLEFTYEMHEATKTPLLRSSEELIETLEDNQVMLQNMMTSKYVAHFEEQITKWQIALSTVDSVTTLWLEVQQTWSHLENIFMGSEDIRAQLPEDSRRFDSIDASYKVLMQEAQNTPNCVKACTKEGLYEKLEHLQGQLALCEKSLAEYLETKRLAFPRFYFVSASDLLDILAKGNMPQEVAKHLSKLFDSVSRLKFLEGPNGEMTKTAVGMYSREDEYVTFVEKCECTGPVEVWLNRLVDSMRMTLKQLLGEAVASYEEKPREQWIFDHPAQITLAGTQIWWTTEVNVAFSRLEEGYENSLKDYYKKQVNQLTALISLIQGELTGGNRQMIMTVCTLDVHARDIVAKLIAEKAENAQCFGWQCQLRLRWDDVDQNDCFINICDALFRYNHEYLGNTPRLVITALTDRCYITLTQSLHLIMGGAPAGPAGTGKTETVKDLGKALAIMVYVFNCSEQMDYKSIGNIFKGLAQSGAWGCFDEFNRIAVEVLSVVATQVKSIQDALRAKKKRFIFQGEEIGLVRTVGEFITMNPGYAGRTELPENIKALFRPCSMVVPNLELICEIMLMAEGFIEASSLARKFNTLYKLNRELLSKQDHYDWGLRAIKSVLVVAGSLKRSDPNVPEEHVLMRALRDFNLPKIVTDDLQVFHGLIGDLFPKVEVLRKRNEKLEDEIRKATIEQGLQAEDIFVLKVVQLEELMAVRHCVFIIGNSGTGKSQIWKMLSKTYVNMGRKCTTSDLNPKAVSTDDLFGCINPSTREWKDGLFSCILREMANAPGTDPKWMILDGDIDPNWIESLNCFPATDHEVLTAEGFMTLAEVQRHFKQHDTLEIACYVDGRLEYHAITKDKLTIKTGRHTLVDFKGRAAVHKDARLESRTVCNNVDLSPTANHRMYAMVAPTRQSASGQRKWRTDANSPPAYRILRADEVVAAGEQDESTVAQLRTNAELGFMPAQDDLLSLPFMDALGLKTAEQAYAFLELYGYWLGNGHLGSTQRGVCFAVAKPRDCAYLEGLLAAVGLPKLKDAPRADRDMTECDGYFKCSARSSGQCSFTITARCWWTYFARQYGHKYKGYWCEVAALEGALMRGSGVPLGRYRPAVPAESVEQQLADLLLRGPPHLAKDAENKPPESSQQRPPAKRVASEPSADAPCKARRVDVLATIARLHDTSMSEPSPPAAEDVKSVDWFWYWVHRHLSGDALRAIVRGLKCADGSHAAGCNANDNRRQESDDCIGTSSARFRDELTRVLLLAGFSTHFELQSQYGDHQDGIKQCAVPIATSALHWKVWFSDKPQDAQPQLHVRDECTTRTWSGTVWCVTVPTKQNLIVFRRVQKTAPDGTVLAASRPVVVGNTVMDDNKMLTLASNERIPLKSYMRLVFEIGNLKYATPATVSRAGILYLNTTDLGWNPYVQSWLEKREDAAERSSLSVLFDRYVNPSLEAVRSGRFKMANVEEFSMVAALCNILEGLLTPVNTPKGCDKEWFEIYFVFAAVWAFGGCVFQDQLVDYRNEFSKWWNSEFKVIKFPPSGTVFDYYVETETKRFLPWTDRVPVYEYDSEMPLQAVLVHTPETTRIRYFLDLLADNNKPVLLIGNAGCGKTVLMQDKLNSYGEDRLIINVPFNFYTTAWSLQAVLEKPLEKKAGRNYGPPGNKKIVYFLDDLNMPEVDKYGTASPHTLLRQFLDYRHWYDRAKLTLKEIHNCQYVACMNPTAGSFTIDPRLQRHFACFAVNFPGVESLQSIYLQILSGHLKPFPPSLQKLAERIVTASLILHKKVASTFLPTAVKFHYIFNLRDLSNIFQGILFSTKEKIKDTIDLVRLFVHETTRTYGDKMVEEGDRQTLVKIQEEILKKNFEDMDQAAIKSEPNVFAHFAGGMGEPKYGQVKDWAQLRKLLDEAQLQYEEVNAAMNLVLFEDAMSHICRINRILESPRGNALLVGVGGSGKQSLSRMAAFISQMDVFQITLRKGYGLGDLKTDLASLFVKTGQKKMQIMFLLTDSQIADEKFLVLINDLLASGNIPGLFPDEEVEGIINSMRGEAKAQGLVDTREVCWDIFIRLVRRNLKVVLCFSPVGNTLRSRCRKFPAIVNCTMIDWFQEWPEEALTSVANRFISSFDLVSDSLKVPVTKFMSFAHMGVNAISRKFLLNEKRYNYTTPKSFLALISLYKEMLEKKALELTKSMDRLENGLTKLQATAGQVDDLKEKLATQEVELKSKNEEANRLIERVAVDTEKVNKEKAIAAEEEKKVDVITKEVGEKQASCEKDLSAAEPALAAASAALNTLNKANLTELKSFGSPSEEVKNVAAACMVLLSPPGKIAKDRSWKAAKNMMAKVDAFLESLINFNKENIDQSNLDALQPYLADPNFNEEFMRSKSMAAASLCAWAVNIVAYYHVYCDVEPKRKALEAANAELMSSQARLRDIQSKISELDRNLGDLRAKFEKATADKLKCEEEAKSTQETIVLANRLVNGLASEKVRWSEAVGRFKEQEKTLAGDVLVSAAFVSYVGCFSKRYREELLNDNWLRYLRDENNAFRVPLSSDVDPLGILTNSAEIAKWNNEGLPTDRVSLENATMVTSCKRWPLIIDPQLQGVTWIKNREGAGLKVVRLGARGYLDAIEKAVSSGDAVLIEDIAESIDPVLNPLLGRETIKKGRYIKMGDKEVEYDPRFKLILQTRRANPHYPPEIQAQTTLINFTVTLAGLEDQLLADVVNIERPDLEKTKADLTKQQNEFKIKLTELEDALLSRLSAAQGNFLGDTALVENLEITKSTATDIEQKVEEAKRTEKKINETRELYRPVAARSSLLYFLLNDLWNIHPMYQYSLNAYKVVFKNAINRADASEDIKERVLLLIDSITFMVFVYTTRGLFERDKLIFTAQMSFQILIASGDIEYQELDFLLRGPRALGVNSTLEWLSQTSWAMVKSLSNLEVFRTLASDIEGSSKQWKKYCENECPENEKLPQEWKNKTPLQKLCILRCLRPDRMTYAVRNFVGMKMGQRYIEAARVPLAKSFEESAPATPIFFILSPGVDPVKEVEALGRQLGISEDAGNFHNVSLGQGQEVIAEQKLDIAYKNGGWVMLENIHLVAKWLATLEKKLEALSTGAHPDFRVFLSAEPAGDPAYHIIPISILQASIKITNEPPTGMQANIHRALDNFSQESLERCSKDAEFRAILFALCYFHAVVLERRKFGTQGWNKPYPFSTGDLMISSDVLLNYLETFAKVPWVDLRYIFGEIMYGGHISDDWDRRLCSAYLDVYLREELCDGNFELAPGFQGPPSSDYKEYHRYIDENLPAESPNLYGLHPNAEIGVLTKMAEKLFKTILEMQPKDAAGGAASSKEEKVKAVLDEIMEKLPDSFNAQELMARVEERTPYISVAIQECDRMSMLTTEIRRSLKELELGLKGDLTISENMELLMNSLYMNEIPARWEKLAYPSLQPLGSWYGDLLQRIKELEGWVAEFNLPSVVWLPGLFNPQSFLTAIMQTTARKNEWPLDRMVLTVDVTKKAREEFSGAPREGAYVHGMFMEGARWDTGTGLIQESLMKELTPPMPVIYIKAVPIDKRETKGVYECPVYRTRQRGPTFVWTFNLKTKERPQKWILAGVCLLCSAE